MDVPCMIYDDERPIASIHWTVSGGDWAGHTIAVGQRDCTRIVAYREPGFGSDTPYYAAYFGEVIGLRVPAGHVTACYVNPDEAA
jgi:hypothetical protein